MSMAGDPPDGGADAERPSSERDDQNGRDRLDIDAEFAAIIADWGDDTPTVWPDSENATDRRRYESDRPSGGAGPTATGRLRGSEWGNDWDLTGDEAPAGARETRGLGPLDDFDPDDLPMELRGAGPRDHSVAAEPDRFVPPEPPPLTSGDTISRIAWAAVVGGPLLLLVSLIWQGAPHLLGLIAVAAFAGGFVTLVARMPPHRGDDDGDGAVV